jgi:hypothetical protein
MLESAQGNAIRVEKLALLPQADHAMKSCREDTKETLLCKVPIPNGTNLDYPFVYAQIPIPLHGKAQSK